MVEVFKFGLPEPVEVVRVVNGELDTCEVDKFPIRLVGGEEHIEVYSRLRKLQHREDGRRYLIICLEHEKTHSCGAIMRKVLEDEECQAFVS